ncbi:MAG: hypothetical protein K0R43_1904 [Pseudoduganella sp.]|jgi:hypothetical protein|nr:hypothetical protein [Pseudoduganella sp.]
MFPHRFTRRCITLLLLLYVALQGYAAAAQVTMPMVDHAACSGHHDQQDIHDDHGMADCLAQCQLCSGPALAPGFSKPSAPAPHDLTGPRTAIIAAKHDGESHLPQQARAPPFAV